MWVRSLILVHKPGFRRVRSSVLVDEPGFGNVRILGFSRLELHKYKRFVALNEMFQRKASKFSIFHEKTHAVFWFSFRETLLILQDMKKKKTTQVFLYIKYSINIELFR